MGHFLARLDSAAQGAGGSKQRRDIRFCHDIGADYVQFSTLVALPGTPLFAAESGRAGSVKNPVDGDLSRQTVSDLPPEALAGLLREAWTGFYLRPRPVLRLAQDAVASGSIGEAARLGAAWGRWAFAAA